MGLKICQNCRNKITFTNWRKSPYQVFCYNFRKRTFHLEDFIKFEPLYFSFFNKHFSVKKKKNRIDTIRQMETFLFVNKSLLQCVLKKAFDRNQLICRPPFHWWTISIHRYYRANLHSFEWISASIKELHFREAVLMKFEAIDQF